MLRIASAGAFSRVVLALVALLLPRDLFAASPPLSALAVSPGESDRAVAIAGRCPTFSWAPAAGATGYELTVFELPEPPGAEPTLVFRRVLAAATSWTPPLHDCLRPGQSYAWAVRGLGDGDSAWSPPRRFTVGIAPSEEEIASALEVLRRAVETEPVRVGARAPDRASLTRPSSPTSTPNPDLALPSAISAIRGEMPGSSGERVGVTGVSSSPDGAGLFGVNLSAAAAGVGVWGATAASAGRGVVGEATSAAGANAGVLGTSASPQGSGAMGMASATTGTSYGIFGLSLSSEGYGVYGTAPRSGVFGVAFDETAGYGVHGRYTGSGTGSAGVLGQGWGGSANFGVRGETDSDSGAGVYGEAMASCCVNQGVFGRTGSSSGIGVLGRAISIWGGIGVQGISDSADGIGVKGDGSGIGVSGSSLSAFGVEGTSESSIGVRGYSNSVFHYAVLGESGANIGVRGTGPSGGVAGESTNGAGVHGKSTSGPGVRGESSQGRGVHGSSVHEDGLYGEASAAGKSGLFAVNTNPLGWAAYFTGNVHVNGTLSKLAGAFTIDHPLEPLTKTLSHSFVESPDMKNLYDGVATLDEQGSAWIELPAWFEALNGELRYQLTPIGGWSPAWIGATVADHRFQIRGLPGASISWQITGTRQDVWARRHRIPVEAEKAAAQQGTSLHPEEWTGEAAVDRPRPTP